MRGKLAHYRHHFEGKASWKAPQGSEGDLHPIYLWGDDVQFTENREKLIVVLASQFGRTLGDAVLIHTSHVPSKTHVLEEKFSLGLCRVMIPDIAVELPRIVVPLRS